MNGKTINDSIAVITIALSALALAIFIYSSIVNGFFNKTPGVFAANFIHYRSMERTLNVSLKSALAALGCF